MADSAVSLQHSRLAWLRQLTHFEERGLVIGLIVIALLIGIPHPDFFSYGSVRAVLRQSAFVGFMAFGMVFLIAMREIDLSISGMFSFGSMFAAVLIKKAGIDPWLAFLMALGVGVLMGTFNGLLTNLIRVPLLIVSIGTLPVFFGLTFLVCKGYAIGGLPRKHSFFASIGGLALGVPVTVWIAVLCGIVLWVVLAKTRFGATVRTIGSNPAAAELIGIRVRRTRVYTTALMGFLSAMAGAEAAAFFKAASPSTGVGMELRVIAAVVIGGTSLAGGSGTMLGAALGAIIISMIDSGIVFYGINPNYAQLVTGLVIVAALTMDRFVRQRRSAGLTG
jgi:ribose transport system permease protein